MPQHGNWERRVGGLLLALCGYGSWILVMIPTFLYGVSRSYAPAGSTGSFRAASIRGRVQHEQQMLPPIDNAN